MNQFEKFSTERYPITVSFVGKIPDGYTLSDGTVAAVKVSDSSDASTVVLVSTTATIAGELVSVEVQAGSSGVLYKITFVLNMTPAGVVKEEIVMKIR